MLLCFVYFLFIYLFFSFLYSVIRYSLSSPPRIAMLTAGYNGLCNLTQVNKVCVCVNCKMVYYLTSVQKLVNNYSMSARWI